MRPSSVHTHAKEAGRWPRPFLPPSAHHSSADALALLSSVAVHALSASLDNPQSPRRIDMEHLEERQQGQLLRSAGKKKDFFFDNVSSSSSSSSSRPTTSSLSSSSSSPPPPFSLLPSLPCLRNIIPASTLPLHPHMRQRQQQNQQQYHKQQQYHQQLQQQQQHCQQQQLYRYQEQQQHYHQAQSSSHPLRPLLEPTMASILQARDLICQNIASLAKRQKLDRAKTQNVQGLIQLTSKARHTVDCSAGLLPLLQHLLASQPQAFVPPSNGRSAEQGGKTMERGGLERGGGGVGDGGGFSQTPPSIPSMAGLVQHLAADESACYAVSFVDPLGVESIWCNQRMSDLFMTSEELQGLVLHTGMGTPHFWARFLTGPGLADLTAAFTSLLVGPSAHLSLDAVLDCCVKESTKEGMPAGVRKCVASVGMVVTDEGPGSILILRVLPCGRRDLGVGMGGKGEDGEREEEEYARPLM
ncbi:hypothetical protein VYU27_006682 [Nannochloropsis oceanica]